MGMNSYSLDGNRLTIRTALEAGYEEELRRQLDLLLARPETELVVDLSVVEYMHSLSVAALSYAWVEAISREKELSFVVSQQVADIFERTGLSKVFSYKRAFR